MGLALSMSHPLPKSHRLSAKTPNTNPLISSCPLFHILLVTVLWHPFQPQPVSPSFGSEALGIFQSASVLLAYCSWKLEPEGARTGPGCPAMLSLFPLLLTSHFLEQSLFPNTPPLPGFPSTDAPQVQRGTVAGDSEPSLKVLLGSPSWGPSHGVCRAAQWLPWGSGIRRPASVSWLYFITTLLCTADASLQTGGDYYTSHDCSRD